MSDTDLSEWMQERIEEECKGLSPEDARTTRLAMQAGFYIAQRDEARREVERLKEQLAREKAWKDRAYEAIEGAESPIEEAIGALEWHNVTVPGLNSALADLQTV